MAVANNERRLRALKKQAEAIEVPKVEGAGEPFTGTIYDVMAAADLTGPSWAAWRVFLSSIFALPMNDGDLDIFRRHTDRTEPPAEPVREAWMAVGRRGGKSRIMALVA